VPQSIFAQMTLSRAQVDWGNPADALPWLEKPGHKNGSNPEVHLLAARDYLALAQKASGAERQARLDAASQRLARARELDPASPGAALGMLQLDLLARGEPGADGLESIFGAWRNARDVAALNKVVALVFAWRGDGISSGNLLRSMASDQRDPATAKWAGEWKHRLDAGVTLADVRDGLAREVFAGGTFREWTIDHESVMESVRNADGIEEAQALLPPTVGGTPGASGMLGASAGSSLFSQPFSK